MEQSNQDRFEVVTHKSENGREIAILQGEPVNQVLSKHGLQIWKRYRIHKRSTLGRRLNDTKKSVEVIWLSEGVWGIRAHDALTEQNKDWYMNSLNANPKNFTVWWKHDGAQEVWVIEQLKDFRLQDDGSVSIWGGFFLLEEPSLEDVVRDQSLAVDTLLGSKDQ